RALGAQARAAACHRRAQRRQDPAAEPADQRRGPLLRRRPRGPAHRRRLAQADDRGSRRRRPRPRRADPRRRAYALAGGDHRLRRAGPARLQADRQRHRARASARGGRARRMSRPKPAAAWPIYRRLTAFAKKYRGLLLLALVGMVIEAAAGGAFTKLMEPVVNETFVVKDEANSAWLPLAIVGLFLLRGIAGYLTDYNMARAGRGIARDMRVKVLGKYLSLPGLRFDTEPVPSMLVRLGSDSDQVAQATIDAAKVMLQQSFQIIAALVVMLWTSWQVTLAVLVLAPPLAWVMDKVGKRYRRVSHRIQESSADLM